MATLKDSRKQEARQAQKFGGSVNSGSGKWKLSETLINTFLESLVPRGTCLLWEGWIFPNGYGRVSSVELPGGYQLAHRFAYYLAHRELPEDLVVRHTCDTRNCCNPEHLILGTLADNIQDRVDRNRSARGSTHGQSRLTELEVLEIREKYATGQYIQKQLAQEYGVDRSMIGYITRNKNWTHI